MVITARNAPSKEAPSKKEPTPRRVAKKPPARGAAKKVTAKKAPPKRTAEQSLTPKTVTRGTTAKRTAARKAPATMVASSRTANKAGGSPRRSISPKPATRPALRVVLESGPRGKKFAAVAPDWPGLERGAKTREAATESLLAYLPRYARVAKLAKMGGEFAALTTADVVEQYTGTGSTDFWGISFGFSSIDTQDMSSDQLKRGLTLMQACWSFFDDVRARVSAEMQKGPRGGGRDRDRIVRHTLGVEQDWARKVGVHTPQDAVVTDAEGLTAYRDAYCTAIRTFHAEGKMARTWPLRYLIRHTAYHTMDHAWEMEDKDLTEPRR